jgi:hypothetical protein
MPPTTTASGHTAGSRCSPRTHQTTTPDRATERSGDTTDSADLSTNTTVQPREPGFETLQAVQVVARSVQRFASVLTTWPVRKPVISLGLCFPSTTRSPRNSYGSGLLPSRVDGTCQHSNAARGRAVACASVGISAPASHGTPSRPTLSHSSRARVTRKTARRPRTEFSAPTGLLHEYELAAFPSLGSSLLQGAPRMDP